MASLRSHPQSPFWIACFTLPDGTRTNRSTGTTDKRIAQRIALEFETASLEAKAGRLVEARVRKTISDMFNRVNVEKMTSSTTGDFLDAWLKRKNLEAAEGTCEKYTSVVKQFKEYLGARLKRDISGITAADITGFRDFMSGRISVGSTNVGLKIIRAAFAQAVKDGLCDTNEACRVSVLKRRGEEVERRPFTIPELKRIIEVANNEWRGLILFGLYTGQRLGDLARLTWRNLDLQQGQIQLVTGKTGRRQIIPIAPPLLRFIETMDAGDRPDAPLFPESNATATEQGRVGNLSNQFYKILIAANLVEKRTHKANAASRGRGARRQKNELSFHCLRHTATSLLKNAGVPELVARELIGHDSAEVSRNYTHVDSATMRSAADKLPDITKP